jgi:hypothetical protein
MLSSWVETFSLLVDVVIVFLVTYSLSCKPIALLLSDSGPIFQLHVIVRTATEGLLLLADVLRFVVPL